MQSSLKITFQSQNVKDDFGPSSSGSELRFGEMSLTQGYRITAG